MNEFLFSYGTLQKKRVQLDLFGRVLQEMKDTLECYKTVSIEIKDEKFLANGEDKLQRTLIRTSDNNDRVGGTVLELSSEELAKADQYEPDNYKRIKVTLRSGKEAWIYLAV